MENNRIYLEIEKVFMDDWSNTKQLLIWFIRERKDYFDYSITDEIWVSSALEDSSDAIKRLILRMFLLNELDINQIVEDLRSCSLEKRLKLVAYPVNNKPVMMFCMTEKGRGKNNGLKIKENFKLLPIEDNIQGAKDVYMIFYGKQV